MLRRTCLGLLSGDGERAWGCDAWVVEGPLRTGRADAAFLRFFATLNERQARLCAVERALAQGRGGITRVAQVTGLTAKTIRKGIAELRAATPPAAVLPPGRSWRPGGGRKKVETVAPGLLPPVREIVEASTAGSPDEALR